MKDSDIAYIHIVQFDQSLSADFKKAVFEILQRPVKSLVLDLRNNPGGYLEVSQEIAGWFLEKGQVVTIEDFGKKKEPLQFKANGNSALSNYPMVVLINNGSASASEILAGALRYNKGVKLVGEKSFGKGSVQELLTLRDGQSFLKVTVAKWLTPKGASISEVGLTPDVVVKMSEDDLEREKDPQLEKAIEIVKGLK
jgi:carboxyl-terminal processing protease